MKIERINENTLKFYISYLDIENRGFDREEIWYNRERSEELFWQMMDEAHNQEAFSLEGPLWIQVQALEKGMEIIVTRAQLSQDGLNLELPISENKHLDIPVSEGLEQLLNEQHLIDNTESGESGHPRKRKLKKTSGQDQADSLSFIIGFEDFEDVIALSHTFIKHEGIQTGLYAYKGKYYLNVIFYDGLPEQIQDNDLSTILEYGFETDLTIYVLKEYGTEIIAENALTEIKARFSFRP